MIICFYSPTGYSPSQGPRLIEVRYQDEHDGQNKSHVCFGVKFYPTRIMCYDQTGIEELSILFTKIIQIEAL